MPDVIRGQRGLGMTGHHQPNSGKNDEWLTPPEIIKALGPFDLDVCAPITRPWPMADRHFTIDDDGLSQDWGGVVWCNPPYGQQTWRWLDRMADHGNGIALTFARTETAGFFETGWLKANAMLFISGRLFFYHADGTKAKHNSGAPSVLLAYGEAAVSRMARSGLHGAFVKNWSVGRNHGNVTNPDDG